jgi:phenylpropionate dioxygenase-like ring-hydroxylating dioxygenase large terminal subunit
MDRNEFNDLAKRLLNHVESGTTDQASEPFAVPVSDYLDQGRWQHEIDAVFRRVPLAFAAANELPEPGDYKAVRILDTPVLLTRGKDGRVRGFLNVCRHRGAQVVEEGCARSQRFSCPYHAWLYDSEGALVSVPGSDTFGPIDTDARGLTPLPVEERSGLIFGSLDRGTELDLDAWLSGFDAELDAMELDAHQPFARNIEAGANWKIVGDGYLEGYHFASLHATTINLNNFSNVMTVDSWGPHQRIGFPRRNIEELRSIPEDEWEAGNHVSIVYCLFPNTAFAFSFDSIFMSQLFPDGAPDRSRTHQMLMGKGQVESEGERVRMEKRADTLFSAVRDEDYLTGFGIQRGLATGANEEFVFGRNELGVHHFHRSIDDLLHTTDGAT